MRLQACFAETDDAIRGDAPPLHLELDLPAQGVSALFGPSGCGKTTLLRALAGLDRHPQASLRFGEATWQDAQHFLPTHRRAVGYVFQEASLFPHLDVRRNLLYAVKRRPPGHAGLDLDRLTRLLGLEELSTRKPHTLSGGERQRVAIARALAAGPQLLLMDEPLASLDAESRRAILPYLEDLHRELEIPVLYVSHDLDEVARLADHLLLMEAGRILASGPIHAMLTRLDLPLASWDSAAAVLETTGHGFDERFHLTHLTFPGGELVVPGEVLAKGAQARVKVAARDVSLTLEQPHGTSIQNILPCVVEEVQALGRAQVMVRLRVGEGRLLARITQKSAQELALLPEKEVYAQVKSVSLLAS